MLYEQEKAAEGLRVAAEAQLYTRQQAADAEVYAKMKEAEGLKVLAKAQGIYISTLLKSLGGNYNALRDYLMINGGMLKEIAQINAEAIKGLQPKISVWSNGGGTIEGSGSGNAAMKEIASVYRALPPLFQTVHDQTGMLPPAWMGSLPGSDAGQAISNLPES